MRLRPRRRLPPPTEEQAEPGRDDFSGVSVPLKRLVYPPTMSPQSGTANLENNGTPPQPSGSGDVIADSASQVSTIEQPVVISMLLESLSSYGGIHVVN